MSWITFLQNAGAQFDEQGAIIAFDGATPSSNVETATALIPLPSLATLQFEGDDSQTFLQGQLSSDIRAIGIHDAQYSSYSTPKGRMLATFLMFRDGDNYMLQLPRSLAASIQKRLAMYIMRSKTKVTDISDVIVNIGLIGKKAAELLATCGGAIPSTDMQSCKLEGGYVIRLSANRFMLSLTTDAAIHLYPKMAAAGALPLGESAWTLSCIRAGVVTVLPQTQEAYVPQMANMELIGAVNFKKGCYPGQEIVARTQYLGKLKRRAIRVISTTQANAGEEVFSPEMNGQPCGSIAMAAQTPLGDWEALAVVQTSSIEHGLHLGSVDGPSLTLLDLPYSLG